MVGSLGWYNRFLSCLGCSSQPTLGRQSCRVACLVILICASALYCDWRPVLAALAGVDHLGAVLYYPAAGLNIVFILTHTHTHTHTHKRLDHSYYAWHEGPVLFGTHAVSMLGPYTEIIDLSFEPFFVKEIRRVIE